MLDHVLRIGFVGTAASCVLNLLIHLATLWPANPLPQWVPFVSVACTLVVFLFHIIVISRIPDTRPPATPPLTAGLHAWEDWLAARFPSLPPWARRLYLITLLLWVEALIWLTLNLPLLESTNEVKDQNLQRALTALFAL